MSKNKQQEKVAVIKLTASEKNTLVNAVENKLDAEALVSKQQQRVAIVMQSVSRRYPDASDRAVSSAIYEAVEFVKDSKATGKQYNALKSMLSYIRLNGVARVAAGKKPTSKKVAPASKVRVPAAVSAAAAKFAAVCEQHATEKVSARKLGTAAFARALA